MEELKFDSQNVNIDLAREFFKNNNNKFYGDQPGTRIGNDGYNQIFYTDNCRDIAIRVFDEDDKYKLNNLARLIEENADLFAQIEFAIRKKPMREVKKYDIPLIAGYLRLLAAGFFRRDFSHSSVIMYGTAPLANLGCICPSFKIVCDLRTAAVSKLFAQLCSTAGLQKPNVIIKEQLSSKELEIIAKQEAASCLGVVTGSSDVDSAVDVFLRSTTKYPWKLSRILIEESIYESFKSALSWKCRGNDATTEADTLCAEIYKYGDKIFMCDYAGVQNVNGIYVEAYRTTKELINLLAKYNPNYLSLWCDSISEAYEISYSDSAPFVVWINDYGLFGPPKASLPYYEMVDDNDTTCYIKKSDAKKIDAWRKMSQSDRREKIISELDKIITETNDHNFKSIKKELYLDNDSVTVANNHLCTCKAVSQNFMLQHQIYDSSDHLAWLKLLNDGCIVVTRITNSTFSKFSEELPLILLTDLIPDDTIFINVSNFPFRTKVVWSSYGTVFAN